MSKLNVKNYTFPFILFAFCIGITSVTSYYFHEKNKKVEERELEIKANDIKFHIQNRLNGYRQFAKSSASFFMSSDTITRDEWRYFIDNSKVSQNWKGFQGVGFISIVSQSQLENHTKRFKKEFNNNYEVFPLSEEGVNTPIIFIEPLKDTNLKAIGFNSSSNPVMRKALEDARDSNEVILTGKVTLIQESGTKKQYGSVLYAPIYKRNMPIHTVKERREAIIGWSGISFRMNDFMEGLISHINNNKNKAIHIKIYEGTLISDAQLLYDNEVNYRVRGASLNSLTIPFEFSSRSWTLLITQPRINFFESLSFLVFVFGLLISFLLSYLVYSSKNTAYLAQQMAEKLTVDISDKNEELINKNILLKESHEQLEIAKEKAEESNRLKSAFLANMSHEIRTPMNSILGFTELLKNEELSEDKKEHYYEIVHDSSKRLMNLISDIIDISKIDAHQLNFQNTVFNLNKLLDNLTTQFEICPKLRAVKLQTSKILKDENSFITCDETRLTQVLSNLLENAIKFTSEGSIECGYRVTEEELLFFVKDTGVGIKTKDHKMIFDRFGQSENTINAKEGTGLGLSISKGIVEALGGRIWVESTPLCGSTFYFTIPYCVVNSPEIIDDKKMLVGFKNENTRTILIAEDEESNFLLIEAILEKHDFNFHYAKNGKEALELFQKNKVDLILMDFNMPVMNGEEAVKEIRKVNSAIPIIALTAYVMAEDKERATAIGCDDFLSKPINRRQLLETINKYVN